MVIQACPATLGFGAREGGVTINIVEAAIDANITLIRGDTFRVSWAGTTELGNLEDALQLWFTVKAAASDADAVAKVQITLTGGLVTIAGAAAATPGNGSITIDDAVVGDVTIYLDEVETAKLGDDASTCLTRSTKLPVAEYVYDIQLKTTDGDIRTLAQGVFRVQSDLTLAT